MFWMRFVRFKLTRQIQEMEKPSRNKKGNGCIYFDTSLKETRHGRHLYHNKYCAEITINNVRYRHRSKSRSSCEEFIIEMRLKHLIR